MRAQLETKVEELDELKGAVRVLCRLRPPKNPAEPSAAEPAPDSGGRAVVVAPPAGGPPRAFEFDRTFSAEEGSASVFDELRPLTRKVASGCSAAILAYGQTGSGKTHTVRAHLSLRNPAGFYSGQRALFTGLGDA